MIKPAFFKHADLFNAERETGLPLRVAFAGLWTVADKAGRFKWKPDLKPDILPYDDVDMMAVLSALESYGFVKCYVVAGKQYGLIPSFHEHQTFHKTERASTLPAPLFNGESTVNERVDTGTGTVAVTQLDVVDDSASDASQSPVSEPALTAMYLSIWANSAVTERWGEKPNPYTPAQSEQMAAVLRAAGVEWQTARASIYAQCRESKAAVPPRSPGYFRPGIEKAWAEELARRAVAASGEKPPPLRLEPSGGRATGSIGHGAPREHWTDKKAREEREAGERERIRIRAGNVEQRRGHMDGEAWYERMKREATAAGKNVTLYAYDRMHEPADLAELEVAHVHV